MNLQDIFLAVLVSHYVVIFYLIHELSWEGRLEFWCMFIDDLYFNVTQSLTGCLTKIFFCSKVLDQRFWQGGRSWVWDGCRDCQIILYIISICCLKLFLVLPVRSQKHSPEIGVFSLLFTLPKSQFSSFCVFIICCTQLWIHIWL